MDTDNINDVYWERNKLVAVIARLWPAGKKWENSEWCIIYVDGPAGQMSWHVHENDMIAFASLPDYWDEWDGHDTEDKYTRLTMAMLKLTRCIDGKSSLATFMNNFIDELEKESMPPNPDARNYIDQIEQSGVNYIYKDRIS